MEIPYLVFEPEAPDAPERVYWPAPGCYVVGRDPAECDIVLDDEAISKRHALVFVGAETGVAIQDAESAAGVFIDDRRIAPGVSVAIDATQNVALGGFLFYVVDQLNPGVEAAPLAPRVYADANAAQLTELESKRVDLEGKTLILKPKKKADSPPPADTAKRDPAPKDDVGGMDVEMTVVKRRDPSKAAAKASAEGAAASREERRYQFPKMPEIPEDQQDAVDRFVYRRVKPLFDQLFQERTGGRSGGTGPGALREMTEDVLRTVLKQQQAQIPPVLSVEDAVKWCTASFMDYGPLQGLLGDDRVTEIMVNGFDDIYIEKSGRLTKSHLKFWNEGELRRVIEKMVMVTNRRIDEQQPYQDTRLEDGSRVNVIIRPLALSGDSITIRKFPNKRLWIEDLIKFGSLDERMADFLRRVVVHRANVVVSGGTGSGKTTLLNVLSNFIPKEERLVSIEDSAELRLNQPNKVTLETRPKSAEGTGAVTIRDLVINALRMRPDRIIVGECRGGESMDMLQAMNTGHDGSLTTLHANSPRDALGRLETMCLMSGMELPAKAIRAQISSAVNFIVQQSRLAGGVRKVTSITEILGMEGDQVVMQEVFRFVRTGTDDDGRAKGHFEATGVVPQFVAKLREDRIDFPVSMFSKKD